MCSASFKGPSDGVLEAAGVYLGEAPDEEEVHEILRTGCAPVVLTGVGVQLLGDLALERYDQEIHRSQTDIGQKAGALSGFGIPGIRWGSGDVHLKWFEEGTRQGGFNSVSHGESQPTFPQFLPACNRESEVIAEVLCCSPADVLASSFRSLYVVSV
jgi:hypothetical protein